MCMMIVASQNVQCHGLCNGKLTGAASGGTPPYTYLWNTTPASTTLAVNNLCPGNYLFSVHDSHNCNTFSNGVITEPTALTIAASSTATSCGLSAGHASSTVSGGVNPYSYLWSNNANTDTTGHLASGIYTVTATDANGCQISTTANVGVVTASQNLCMLTVDSFNHNVVIWEKPVVSHIKGYNIYRNIAGTYSSIAFVPYASLSQYVDLTFGVDPTITSYRYKVSAVDSCGNESALSPYHQTIHLTSNLGVGNVINLLWDNYQGFAFSYNRILRDSTFTGHWQVMDSVSSTNFSWTDLHPPVSGANYIIEIVTPSPCITTMRQSGNNNTLSAIVKSKSNISNNRISGIRQEQLLLSNVMLYPNPASDVFTLDFNDSFKQSTIEVINSLGAIVKRSYGQGGKTEINVSDLDNGLYYIRISNPNKQGFSKKLTIQR